MKSALPDHRLIARLQTLSQWFALVVLTMGIMVIIGWIFNIDLFKSLVPGHASMKFNTAVSFALAGIGLVMIRRRPVISQVTAVLIILLGSLTLIEYLFGFNLGIDQAVIRDITAVQTAFPGRMSPIAASNLILLGTAFLLMLRTQRSTFASILVLMATFISMLALIGYIYNVVSLYRIGSSSSTALHTAATFVALCLSMLFAFPTKGFAAVISDSTVSGYMVRRLLPAAILAPIIVGWLRWQGEVMGLYDTSFGLALFTASNIVISTVLILLVAPRLHSMDMARRDAVSDLRQLNDQLESRVEGRTRELTIVNQAMEAYVIQAKNAEESFRAVLESAPDAMIILNTDGEIMLVNAQTMRVFGYQREELTGQKVEMLLPERFGSRYPAYVARFLTDRGANPSNAALELQAVRKNGTQFPVEISLSPIETKDGILIASAVRDITERKRIENALRENEDKLQTIFQLLPVGASVLSPDRHVVQMNLALEKILGLSMADVYDGRHKNRKYIHPDGSSVAAGEFPSERALRDGEAVFDIEFGIIKEDDTTVWTSISAAPLPRNQGAVTVTADITRRKQIEEDLKLRVAEEQAFQEYLKALHEITIDLTTIDDLDLFYKTAVEFGLQRLGFERLGLLLYDAENGVALGTYGTDAEGHLAPEHHIRFDPSLLTNILMRALEKESRFAVDEHAELFSNFEPIGTGWNAAAVLWNGEEKLGWLAADNGVRHQSMTKPILDILGLYALTLGTLLAQKKTRAALQQSERQLSLLAENSPDNIYILDMSLGRPVYMNRAEFLGYSQTEVESWEPLFNFVHPDDKDRVLAHWDNLLKHGKRLDAGILEYRLQDKQGEWQWIESRESIFAAAPDGKVRQVLLTLSVVTIRKEAERQAVKLEKEGERVKMLSDFFRDTSHEFRTPLAVLGTSLYLLTKAVTPEQRTKYMERGEQQIKHLVRMLDRLQLMGRLDGDISLELEAIDINRFVKDFCIGLQGDASAKPITIEEVLTGEKIMVQANREEFSLALLELGQNALLFTPPEGTVTVRTQLQDHHVMIDVTDTGIGIPAEDLPYVFDRLYRVDKARSQETGGIGLGLSIAKRIVELHQGELTVESVPEKGSTFRICLPLSPETQLQASG